MQAVDAISIDLSFSVMAVRLNWLNHLRMVNRQG